MSVHGFGDGQEDTLHWIGDAVMFRIDPVGQAVETGLVKLFSDSGFSLSGGESVLAPDPGERGDQDPENPLRESSSR